MSAGNCDCERLVAAYSLPIGSNSSLIDAEGDETVACAYPIRWTSRKENKAVATNLSTIVPPGKKLGKTPALKNGTSEATKTTAENKQASASSSTMRPFRPAHLLKNNYTFYGFASSHDEDPPDREAYISFFVEDRMTKNRSGTFVEVGAGDGKRHSNTLFFEESLGWGGLLIEGDQKDPKKMPSPENRRAARTKRLNYTICAPDKEGEEVRFVGNGDGAGVEVYMPKYHLQRFESSWERNWKQNASLAKCSTLRTVLERERIGSVDFMSMNIAGAEKAAIEGLDETKVHVRVLVVTMEKEHGGIERAIRKLLMGKGFCFSHRLGANEYWVGDDVLKRAHCAWVGLRQDP